MIKPKHTLSSVVKRLVNGFSDGSIALNVPEKNDLKGTGMEVTFQITGMIGRYKGRIVNATGHNGKPEIEVTHVLSPSGSLLPTKSWPRLKDGDYILETQLEKA